MRRWWTARKRVKELRRLDKAIRDLKETREEFRQLRRYQRDHPYDSPFALRAKAQADAFNEGVGVIDEYRMTQQEGRQT